MAVQDRSRGRRNQSDEGRLDQAQFSAGGRKGIRKANFRHRSPKIVDPIVKSSRDWRSLKSRSAYIRKKEGLSPVESDLLAARGLRAGEELRQFLSPDFQSYLERRLEMVGLGEAAEKVVKAVVKGEKIAIAFDYDADGGTSAGQLSKLLDHLGAKYVLVGADRYVGGYGFTEDMVQRAKRSGAKLVVTQDIGTSNNASLELARKLGMESVVLDHHDIPKDFEGSKADVIVNPRFEHCNFENGSLCASAITTLFCFEVISQLTKHKSFQDKALNFDTSKLLQLGALGTIGDQMELKGFNRALVAEGLYWMEERPDHWVKALGLVSGTGVNLKASDLAFQFAPRANAPGRLVQGEERPGVEKAVELFRSRSKQKAERLASELNEINVKRRTIERVATRKLLKSLEGMKELPAALVFADEDIHPGVAGIVASRLVEETNRPVFVLTKNEKGQWTGSGRTVEGVPLKACMDEISDCFIKYGGHPQAAGCSLEDSQLAKFQKGFAKIVEKLIGKNGVSPKRRGHIELTIDELVSRKDEIMAAFERLEPTGRGNPSPVVQFSNVTVVETDLIKDRHMQVLLRQGASYIRGLLWHTEEHPDLFKDSQVDLVAWPKVIRHSKYDRSKDELVLELRAASETTKRG